MGTSKKPRGRPRKTAGVKSEAVLLRMDPTEKAGFTEAAGLVGMPLSAWMRARLREMAEMELQYAGRAAPWAGA